MTEQPLLRIGVIADPQYADLDPNPALNRYFRESVAKISAAIETFEGEDLAFVITLGDLIDRGFENFAPALAAYAPSRHECLFLPGNHDYLIAPEKIADLPTVLGMPAPYYSFHKAGIRFLIINGCEDSLFATADNLERQEQARRRLLALKAEGAANAMDWNAGLTDTQFAWIEAELAAAKAAGEPVIVMGHYPIYPEHDHNLWDWQRLAKLFEQNPQVIAYLCGHNHQGNLGRFGNTWCINFRGMVDTPAENAFAILNLHAAHIEIQGFGRQESLTLRR
ncbi:metallophosphoesterase [Rhizobium oryzicola]|uniref:Metallophosphoesterase n=1 Tax=Rhizobium oryzicola TaxID=1232668 RepID=A0ABT8SSZ9_9HYPH|nr:metallophosphoesterase [Rhizobium oryzicola]MDO1581446.1 metallophosphoesterase [Rhizobium oryzicola]